MILLMYIVFVKQGSVKSFCIQQRQYYSCKSKMAQPVPCYEEDYNLSYNPHLSLGIGPWACWSNVIILDSCFP